jgi:hypothetical protein
VYASQRPLLKPGLVGTGDMLKNKNTSAAIRAVFHRQNDIPLGISVLSSEKSKLSSFYDKRPRYFNEKLFGKHIVLCRMYYFSYESQLQK